MLVLSRRPNQSIRIGDDLVVTVLEVKGDQIRLGIAAPRHVQVFREEVLVTLQEANGSAVLESGSAPAVPPSPSHAPNPTPRSRAVPRPPASIRPVGPHSAG